MRYRNILLVFVAIILSIVLLLFVAIRVTPLENLPAPLNTLPICSSMPNYTPEQGVIKPSRVIDLDPTTPMDSKAATIIRRWNGEYEEAFYSTMEQDDEYRKTFRLGDCLWGGIPPACIMGHFPNEPPRTPCAVSATPNPNYAISENRARDRAFGILSNAYAAGYLKGLASPVIIRAELTTLGNAIDRFAPGTQPGSPLDSRVWLITLEGAWDWNSPNSTHQVYHHLGIIMDAQTGGEITVIPNP